MLAAAASGRNSRSLEFLPVAITLAAAASILETCSIEHVLDAFPSEKRRFRENHKVGL
jgi:hypothetical protein